MLYSGSSKVELNTRLDKDWRNLADALDIPASEQRRFKRGEEGLDILEWLENHKCLDRLPEALTFIGRRDLITVLAERLQTTAANLRCYYQSRRERWPPEQRYALDKRFVQLTLLLDQGEETQGQRLAPQPRKFQDLRQLLHELPDYPALVLLGPPGSGKSTLLCHVELDYAQEALAGDDNELAAFPVTFFISLNRYRPEDNQPLSPPGSWLEQRWEAMCPNLPPLDTLLQEGRMILLLDALNEMPHQGIGHIEAWRQFLVQLAETHPRNRVIFSCRTQDYGFRLSSSQLRVHQVRIEQLSDEQVQEFLVKYYPDYGAVLWQELRSNPRQLDIYRSPYFLTLLIGQAGTEGKIPTGRAALFSGFIRQALRHEIEHDNSLFQAGALLTAWDHQRLTHHEACTGCELPDEGPLFPALSTLAYRMQETDRHRETSQVRIHQDLALDVLSELEPTAPLGFLSRLRDWLPRQPKAAVPKQDQRQAESMLEAGLALHILDRDMGQKEVLFYHQLLQEYFAARRLAAHPDAQLVWTPWQARKVKPDLKAKLAELPDYEPLPLLPSTGWEETTILAAAMTGNPDAFVTALMATNLPLAGRCAAQPDVVITLALRSSLQQALLERTRDSRADLRARIAAGLALGELGDPRFERRQGPEGAHLLPPLVEIPGRRYTLGSNDGLYDDETPVHTVELQPFAIGQFPVTNAEWKLFMEAGGYEDERWWDTAAAKAWW